MLKRSMIILYFLLASISAAVPVQSAGLTYIAIGDSLAAGQTPNHEIGTGYADMIAMSLKPAAYSKQLSVPGYTVDQVIKQVESDQGQRDIQRADMITISAGANNLLRLIQNDSTRGLLTFNAVEAAFALNEVREDWALLLDKIYKTNPDVDIYAMGYYFPYPHVFEQHKPAAAEQVSLLNKIIKQEAEKAGAVFVPVAKQFGTDAVDYIPNPGDVHPGPEGYLTMANAFLNVYAPGTVIPGSILKDLPKPVSFEELRKAAAQAENQKKPLETKKTAAVKGCTKKEVYAMAL